ncbi:Dna2/Cas4 domain-containing protein [Lachnospira pectinoschiza]
MKVNGTLMNYYFHCKRQCYLHGNRMQTKKPPSGSFTIICTF